MVEPEAVPEPDDSIQIGSSDGGIVGVQQITPRAYRNGDVFFVRSSTARGKFYMVAEGACSCKGFEYRHTCNHISHLLKEGFLVQDHDNGMGLQTAKEIQTGEQEAATVTTGIRHSLSGSGEEIERRDAQIRRVQDFARIQRKMIAEQQRLITAIKVQNESAVRRSTKMVSVVGRMLVDAGEQLQPGDLVELDMRQ